jgi:K+/H+ antiporter YhaU regulatory subunit KhtT
MLPGLGELAPVKIEAGSPVVGRSLGDLNLRGVTGATVVALTRGEERRAYPDAEVRLEAGDLIAVTGTHQAVTLAEALMHATDTKLPPTDTAATADRVARGSEGSAGPVSEKPADTPS